MIDDDELMTPIRADFEPVRMSVPTETIMARGRAARRSRRRQVAGAGALVVALGAGLGIPTLTSGSTAGDTASASIANRVTLTAWTAVKQPDGAILVTIPNLQNLPALQARLTADGARVAVGAPTSGGPAQGAEIPPSACFVDGYGPANPAPVPAAVTFHYPTPTTLSLTIMPAKVPAGDMVRLGVSEGGPNLPGSPAFPGIFAMLVHDSPNCGF